MTQHSLLTRVVDSQFVDKQTHEPVVDLFSTLSLPAFPVGLMPSVIANYAADQSELIGVDPAVICVSALAVAASCIDDRITIQPKRHDPTWTESARIWAAPIGDPSAKKSPAISKALQPLYAIDKKWRDDSAKAERQWKEETERCKKNDQQAPMQPIGKRLIINDVTVEKLGDILSRCEPRGILSYADELSGWLASHDAYKNGSGKDRAAWLEAYNGGSKAIDRVMRGSTFVENWSVCVLGGIQPSVIQSYANSTNHDGMLQRFILVYAGQATAGVDRQPNMQAKEAYSGLMSQLVNLDGSSCPVVKLSERAHVVREALDRRLLMAVKNLPNKFLTAALGKWNGLFARLLLIFHSVECGSTGDYPPSRPVSEDTAQRVSDFMWRTLLPHAMKFYQGLDNTEDHARSIAALILAHQWSRFTVKRDLNRFMRSSRTLNPWVLDDALDRLEAFGWITPEFGKLNEKGRPSAYTVNPEVHSRFKQQAEAERERRKEVAQIMKEMSADNTLSSMSYARAKK